MRDLELELLEATESLVRLRLRLAGRGDGESLTGMLTGPHCRYARTLPAVFPTKQDAEILITEPCYWTAELPFRYDLQVEVRLGDRIIDRVERQIGLHRLAARGPNLFVEGKRHVFRAARYENERTPDWAAWREANLAMWARDPSAELCRAASVQGVCLIAEWKSAIATMTGLEHPAVAAAVVSVDELNTIQRTPATPLVGVRNTECKNLEHTTADFLMYEVTDFAAAKQTLAGCNRPVIAVRPRETYQTLAAARSACEQLQRELAPELNLAGYVV